MINGHVEEPIRLIPCAICTAPFDPATLPAHVYDPYNAFFKFPDHASICSSCFAEELAKRNRPPSRDPHNTGWYHRYSEKTRPSDAVTVAGDFERADSGAGFVSERGIYSHRKQSSVTTISRSASTSRLGSYGPGITHRHGESLGSVGTGRDSRTQDLHRRGMSADQIRKSMETLQSRHSPPQRHSPPTPSSAIRPGSARAQSIRPPSTRPDTSRHSPPMPPSRRHSPPTPSTATMTTQRPSTSNDGTTLGRKSSERDRDRDMVKRKVSFRQGTPVAKAYHPMAPPVETNIPLAPDVILRSTSVRSFSHPADTDGKEIEMQGLQYADEEESTSCYERWKMKRRKRKEEKWKRDDLLKERQRVRKRREDAEKGIGLELFCPACRIVVRTVPEWKDGSCCVLTTLTFALCTGPLSLSLLHPSCAPHIKDAHSTCPHCTTELSYWNRRKNKLTLHTWAGFADPRARPSTGSARPGTGSTRPGTIGRGMIGPRPTTSRGLDRSGSIRLPESRGGRSTRAGTGGSSQYTAGTSGTGFTGGVSHGTNATTNTGATGTTYNTSSSSQAHTNTTGSSYAAGSSNTQSSGADTFNEGPRNINAFAPTATTVTRNFSSPTPYANRSYVRPTSPIGGQQQSLMQRGQQLPIRQYPATYPPSSGFLASAHAAEGSILRLYPYPSPSLYSLPILNNYPSTFNEMTRPWTSHSRRGTPEVFRDVRTGQLVEFESVGRAIG